MKHTLKSPGLNNKDIWYLIHREVFRKGLGVPSMVEDEGLKICLLFYSVTLQLVSPHDQEMAATAPISHSHRRAGEVR